MHRQYHLLILLIFWIGTAFSQVGSSCSPSTQLLKAYRADVADIALQRIYFFKSADTIHIEIPPSYQDTIMGSIAAVCNLHNTYEADSIFLNYCIHRYQKFVKKINLKIDPAISWVANWRALNIHTGDSLLDNFLALHGIHLAGYRYNSYSSIFLQDWAFLEADHPINWRAFADSIMKFHGFSGYEDRYEIGTGDWIDYSTDSITHITFGAGRGDCPSGCTEWKTWNYSVSNNCTVKLDSTSNNIIHLYYPNCNLAPLAINQNQLHTPGNIVLFPNPVQSKLYIQHSDTALLRYTIYDLIGKQQLAGTYKSTGIDVTGLLENFYILIIQDDRDNHSYVRKFIKRSFQ